LICEQKGETLEIDARTSDAIAIGVRFNCPVYTYESILSSAGIMLDENDGEEDLIAESMEEEPVEAGGTLESLTDEELNQQMQEAVENEDYELASKIRDELNKRSSN
jgi:hypothetical protein